jgi:hypothetical protein
MAMMFRAALDPSLEESDILLQRSRTRRGYRWHVRIGFEQRSSSIVPSRGRDTMPRENSSDTNLPYTSKDNSSLTETTSCRPIDFYPMRRGPQCGAGIRPGDWLLLWIDMAIIIGLALVVIGAF